MGPDGKRDLVSFSEELQEQSHAEVVRMHHVGFKLLDDGTNFADKLLLGLRIELTIDILDRAVYKA